MAKKFDATLKGMLEESPGDWPALLGLPRAEAAVIDAGVSTFTGAADKVLRVRGDPDWILHLEFHAGAEASLPRRMQTANVLLDHRHGLMVRSAAVLLHTKAHLANLTGLLERRFPHEPAHLAFRYQVVCVWELPVEPLLTGGLGLLPLAPISAVPEPELPAVVGRIKERLSGPRLRPEAPRTWTAAYLLLGMRYSEAIAERLLEGTMIWEESTTYQAIIRKGRDIGQLEHARKTLLTLGADKFGHPSSATLAAVDAIGDINRLDQLNRSILHSATWEELLATPGAAGGPRRRRRKPSP